MNILAGSIEDTKWENVQVGQVLQVKDDELFPADLLCLYTALPDKVHLPAMPHMLDDDCLHAVSACAMLVACCCCCSTRLTH